MRIYGVGDSNSLLPKVIVPLDMARPIIIGVYHGKDKPVRDQFLRQFMEEARTLHPRNLQRDPLTKKLLRKCSVRIRALICDAKERAFLKGKCRCIFYYIVEAH